MSSYDKQLILIISYRYKRQKILPISRLSTGRGVLWSGFAGYVWLASQNPYPIIVYSVANYRPHLSHFWVNVIVISRTEFSASRLINVKTTAGTIFQLQSSYFQIPAYQNFLISKLPKICDPILVTLLKMLPHYSQSSCENATPSSGTSPVVFK